MSTVPCWIVRMVWLSPKRYKIALISTRKHHSAFYEQERNTWTGTALWPKLILISSPSIKLVFGLNHWKANYLSEMFKTSAFHPIVICKKKWFPPFYHFFKARWPYPTGWAVGKHQMQQVKSILLLPTQPPHWLLNCPWNCDWKVG